MRAKLPIFLVSAFMAAGAVAGNAASPPGEQLFAGLCEASAAVAIEPGWFAVADDDEKDLRVYRQSAPGVPRKLEISKLAGLEKKGDVEGAARIGDDFYWIGSHSRNNSGEERPDRHRLFAITLKPEGDKVVQSLVGKPYTRLLADLQDDTRFGRYGLPAASKLSSEAPGALNIEGLAATPAGGLLIGFRSPVPGGKALIVPLENPRQVLDRQKPSFGAPIELDLGGLGIRSLEYWPARKVYVISAGSPDGAGRFQLYQWAGTPNDRPVAIEGNQLSGLVPEAAFFDSAGSSELIVLSDDGDTCPKAKAFRSRRVPLPAGDGH